MDLGLHGRVALVVGGSGLIGRAVAGALHAEGAVVVLGGRRADALQEAAEAVAPEVATGVRDTADEGSVAAAVEEVVGRHGRVDVLVTTAALPAQQLDPERQADPAQVARAFEDKAMGYLRCVNAVLPGMRSAGWGRVVQVAGQYAYMTSSVTAATRNAGVITATLALADQVAGSGVTLNVVNPGPVTPTPSAEVPLGANGDSTPEQVAALVTYLASEPAGAVSGESIAVGHKMRGFLAF